ncbi:hypothetical protein PLICRDRAFT_133692 [Plicaturopsis crispa FD-325 SS-3]|nr:hypothetical protein PLICRDRAFT_133692 [Plicaturopsis crispa FD-325 SS-3]
MADAVALQLALFIIRVASPAVVLLAALSLLFTRRPAPHSPSPITSVVVATYVPRRAAILSLLSLVALTFLLDGLTFVIYAVLNKTWPYRTGIEVNAIAGIVAFSGLAILGAWKDVQGVQVWTLRRIKTAIGVSLILDIAHVVLVGYGIKHYEDPYPHIPESRIPAPVTDLLHLAFPAFRVLLVIPLFVTLLLPRVVYSPVHADDDVDVPPTTASSLLLPPEAGAHPSTGLSPVAEASKYGTFRNGTSTAPTTRAHTPAPSQIQASSHKAETKPDISLDPSWKEIGRRIRRLTPYLWPSKSPALQFLALLCVGLLAIGRVVNLALPWTLKEVVSIFEDGSKRNPWPYLFAYVALRFLQSSGGLAAVRDTLWAPVMQYSDREMSQLSFDHLLNLSFAFHTRRKTGEVLRILDRGAAINHTLELILFNIVPTILDIIIALVAFVVLFDWTLAFVIFFVMFAYIAASIILTKWRTKIRRQMNDRDIITRAIHTDCLLNYETVKYFGGEEHEGARYRSAVRDYQALEYKVIVSLNLLNLVQNFIITLGLLVGSLIVALRVTKGHSKPSDFVYFITYLAQLYGPLNSLGYIYRSVNQSLVDTERLLKLLNEPTEINDKPDATELVVDEAEVEFDNVSFSYDGRTTALNGISFKVPKGSSVALVGESGAGKSTILRLLYRFYDLGEGGGRILIDGKDIRDVTQASLRKAIGVVPQDSVLFNASIGYNIGYGKFGATQEEIEAAAKAAQMHDRILSFPDGYETKFGERGIRLSGGEKQRVAIARTLLKNPPILLLDEATSALDTSTEKDIQKALQNLVQGRSSLSIAHRLSTIATADVILVLKDGQIVEQGSHQELLELNGVFAEMWSSQISATNEAQSVPVSGYPLDNGDAAPKEERETTLVDVAPSDEPAVEEHVPVDPVADEPEAIVPDAPATEEPAEVESPAPVAFPSAADDTPEPPAAAAPIAFPSDDTASQQAPSERGPAVTFGAVNTPPRSGTPDPESEPKRKRISSQNFQRLAKRISVTARRQGSSSSNFFSPKREGSTPKVEGENSSVTGEDSGPGVTQSALSPKDKDKKAKKDSKKLKRKSIGGV